MSGQIVNDYETLKSGAQALSQFGQSLQQMGSQFKQIHQQLKEHCAGDESGIGGAIEDATSDAAEAGGDVFSQGGRVLSEMGSRTDTNTERSFGTDQKIADTFNGMNNGDVTSSSGQSGSPLLSGSEQARGEESAGASVPSREDVKDALRQLKPQQVDQSKYTSEDGHAYATRVFAGGRPDGETVFAGHGYLEPGAGTVRVPEGTHISFYVDDGQLLDGLSGVAVEAGVYPGQALQTFGPGDEIPNYTLAAPAGSGGGSVSVFENSTTVANRTRLDTLLQPGMGNVHWAACREHM